MIIALRASGADILFTWAALAGAAQTIKKVVELGWKPIFFLDLRRRPRSPR